MVDGEMNRMPHHQRECSSASGGHSLSSYTAPTASSLAKGGPFTPAPLPANSYKPQRKVLVPKSNTDMQVSNKRARWRDYVTSPNLIARPGNPRSHVQVQEMSFRGEYALQHLFDRRRMPNDDLTLSPIIEYHRIGIRSCIKSMR
jgi:hypothetical protein